MTDGRAQRVPGKWSPGHAIDLIFSFGNNFKDKIDTKQHEVENKVVLFAILIL